MSTIEQFLIERHHSKWGMVRLEAKRRYFQATNGRHVYMWQFHYPGEKDPDEFMGEIDVEGGGSLAHPDKVHADFLRLYDINLLDLDEPSYLELESILQDEVRKHDPTFFTAEFNAAVAKKPSGKLLRLVPKDTEEVEHAFKLKTPLTDAQKDGLYKVMVPELESGMFGDGMERDYIMGGMDYPGLDNMDDQGLMDEFSQCAFTSHRKIMAELGIEVDISLSFTSDEEDDSGWSKQLKAMRSLLATLSAPNERAEVEAAIEKHLKIPR